MDESLIFNIRIRDVNDHAPQFPEKEFSITVKESQAAGVLGCVVLCVCSCLCPGCLLFTFLPSCFDIDKDFDPRHPERLFTAHVSKVAGLEPQKSSLCQLHFVLASGKCGSGAL